MDSAQSCDIGVMGLGVMGLNLARNLARNGHAVAGFDLDTARRERLAASTDGVPAVAAASPMELLALLRAPRRVLLMVPAGAVDAVLADLRPLLQPGDIVIDGGNTRYTDTQRRMTALAGTGILYVGAGVSGGEQGALLGPALMPGGDAQAWPVLQPMLQSIAARAPDGRPCCEWMGAGAAGHFVKMVHNGIEYAVMQLIGEAYWVMRQLLGMAPEAIGKEFAAWNTGPLDSYLLAITADILSRTDPEGGGPLLDRILDAAEQKGTGKWTTEAALDLGVPAPTLGDAVFARAVSAGKEERGQAAGLLPGPRPVAQQAPALLAALRPAFLAAALCSYAQGFQLLAAANQEYAWEVPLGAVASVWRAGCIIRAGLLEEIRTAYAAEPPPSHLLLAPDIAALVGEGQQALREIVAVGAVHGLPLPGLMSALAYYDGLRSEQLPANLLQAQRDYFGAHGYRRVDRPGKFHTEWVR